METKPRRRLGILIFCLVFLAVAGAIAATVLLANNGRNLNRVLRSLGLPVVEIQAPPPAGTVEKFRGKRLEGIPVSLAPYLFAPASADQGGVFLRNMRKDGETLCQLFDRLGFSMTSWQPGSFAKNINECYSQSDIPNATDANNPSSFFLMIKGEPDGTLISARVKIVFNDAAGRAKLIEMATRVLLEFSKATSWGEVAAEKDNLAALKPFSSSLGGVSVRFSSEFMGAGRYNLIFNRAPLTREQRRTQNYFDRSKFFPLTPDYGGPPITGEASRKAEQAAKETVHPEETEGQQQ